MPLRIVTYRLSVPVGPAPSDSLRLVDEVWVPELEVAVALSGPLTSPCEVVPLTPSEAAARYDRGNLPPKSMADVSGETEEALRRLVLAHEEVQAASRALTPAVEALCREGLAVGWWAAVEQHRLCLSECAPPYTRWLSLWLAAVLRRVRF